MKKILLEITGLICIAFYCASAQTQHRIRCSTTEHTEWLKTQDPGLAARMDAVERETQDWISSHPNGRSSNLTVTIPVIVHVIYSTASQNISDDMIKSQIDVLNEDYGGYNSDEVKVPPFFSGVKAHDTGVRFALATRDPNGNFTNGIRRISTLVTSWGQNNAVKYTAQGGDDAWPCGSYLNVWVCNLGSNLLGYAQFPGGTCATDGVVLLYTAFGRISPISAYNYGRTTTHEVGHWLNLRHIWGDDGGSCSGTDQVADTPNSADENFGADACAPVTCSNQPNGDMLMNYMDYTDDRYMFMFSAGQNVRIQACLASTRASLATSLGLNIVSPPANDCGISAIINPGGIPCDYTTVTFTPEVTLTNYGSNALTAATINFKIDAGAAQTQAWSGNLAAGASANVILPSLTSTAFDHIFYCWTTLPNGNTDATLSNDRTTRNFIGHAVNTPYPLTQGFDVVTFPPTSWTVKNRDGTKNMTTYTTTCNATTAWIRSSTVFHSGTGSAYYNNFSQTTAQNGMIDDLITQPVDMTIAGANAALSFWVAYAPKSATGFDTLEVFVTTDCGYTFTSVYKKWSTTLATAPATASAFIPNSSQWREEVVSLAPYAGQKNVIILFRNTNHGGNNLYIDDLNVWPVAVNEIIAGSDFNVYPNPTEGVLNVFTKFENPETVQILVSDALGQTIYKTAPKTTVGELNSIDLRSASRGIYFVELRTQKGSVVKKVSLSN